MEITSGIFKAAGNIYSNNKGSILRTIIYTIGHFAIAITVLMLIADVPFSTSLIVPSGSVMLIILMFVLDVKYK